MTDEQVYNQYYARLLAYACGISSDVELARDVVSEVFIEYLKNPPRKVVASWFYMVCRNKMLNKIKREQKVLHGEDSALEKIEASESSPADEFAQNDAFKNLRKLLKTLRPEEQEAISLKYFEDFSYAEIAKIMGISVSGVGTLIFRGMEKLKLELSKM